MFPLKDADTTMRALISDITIFDSYRFVDPQDDSEYRSISGALNATERKCYEIWGRESPCRNCTSKRAQVSGAQLMKLEFLAGEIIFILSTPVILGGRRFVLELAKTVTNSLVVNSAEVGNNRELLTLVNDFNEIAVRDPFTHLYNKPYTEQELASNIAELERRGGTLAAAMIDIDAFKVVNDTYGHQSGDEVIAAVAEQIVAALPGERDWAGRLGGDEFLMVLRDCRPELAEAVCKTLAATVAERVFHKDGQEFHTSISIGLEQFAPGGDAKTFLSLLDETMYSAKRGGRGDAQPE